MRLGLAIAMLLLPLPALAGTVGDGCMAYGSGSERTEKIASGLGLDMPAFCACVETSTAKAEPDPAKFAEDLLSAYTLIMKEAAGRGISIDEAYEALDSDAFNADVSEDEKFRRFELKDRVRAAHSFVMRGYRIDGACPA